MDAPLPLPLADPMAPIAAPALPGVPDAGEPGAVERFATLLEAARITLEPGEQAFAEAPFEAPADEAVPEAGGARDPLEALLFLANVVTPESQPAAPKPGMPDDATAPDLSAGTPMLTVLLPKSFAAAPSEATTDAPSTRLSRRIDSAIGDSRAATHEPRMASRTEIGAPRSEAAIEADLTDAAVMHDEAKAARDALPIPSAAPSVSASSSSAAPTALAMHAPATPMHAAAAPSLALVIDAPLQHPRWREEAAGSLASLVTRGIERAELRVSPAELGPVEVRIDVSGGEATLAIVAVQAATRDALEQALPLLRDLLAEQGLTLGEASVHDGRADRDQSRGDAAHTLPAREAALEAASPSTRVIGGARRLVDVFA